MKKELNNILFWIIIIIITNIINYYIYKPNEIKIKEEIKQKIYSEYSKIQKTDKNNNCSLGYTIYAYEHLFDDGRGSGAEIYAKYKKQESKRDLKNFISEVEKNFSEEDKEFMELFNYNKNVLEQLYKKNIKDIFEVEASDEYNFSPFGNSNIIYSEELFINNELKYLRALLESYCTARQDHENCIKMVFDKYEQK